jgi:hypothetical protein
MTDEEYERATIERFAARAVAAERRAQKAEARVAELEADFARLFNASGEVVREAGFSDGEAIVDGRLVVDLAGARCTKSGIGRAKPNGTDPGAKPPTVHGIELAVGQRWVWRTPGKPESAPSMDSLVTSVGQTVWLSSPFACESDGDRTDSWSKADFERFHPRLRLPEELTPVEPKEGP